MTILTISNTAAPRTFVCIHGFLGTPNDWVPYCATLTQYGNVALVKLPGHDGAPIGPVSSLSDLADHILNALYDTFPGSSFILIGYSLGGRLAYAMSQIASSDIGYVLYISARLSGLSEEASIRRATQDNHHANLLEKDFNAFLHQWYDLPLFQSPHFDGLKHKRISQCLANHAPTDLAYVLRQFSPAKAEVISKTLP